MKAWTLVLVAFAVVGATTMAAPTAEASECTSQPPPICPVGSVPYWTGGSDCSHGGSWTCVWLW